MQAQTPNPNTVSAEAQMEALRRRADLPGSSASIGASAANSPSPQNPISQVQPQAPTGGAEGSPAAGAVGQLKQEKSTSRVIVEGLLSHLRVLGKKGQLE